VPAPCGAHLLDSASAFRSQSRIGPGPGPSCSGPSNRLPVRSFAHQIV
jgi:hypothetical protein